MKERPILFSAPMVGAILEGRKTVTRRVVKFNAAGRAAYFGKQWHPDDADIAKACPYGQPGDRLWVRETWRSTASTLDEARALTEDITSGTAVAYLATSVDDLMRNGPMTRADAVECVKFETWKPSIHMPRWASRITLEITGVRAERVRDISEADAIAEGVHRIEIGSGYNDCFSATSTTWADVVEQQAAAYEDPRLAFRDLWDGINEQRGFGWLANPYVWVIEFKRIPQEPDA